jgi:hypothetical protein
MTTKITLVTFDRQVKILNRQISGRNALSFTDSLRVIHVDWRFATGTVYNERCLVVINQFRDRSLESHHPGAPGFAWSFRSRNKQDFDV